MDFSQILEKPNCSVQSKQFANLHIYRVLRNSSLKETIHLFFIPVIHFVVFLQLYKIIFHFHNFKIHFSMNFKTLKYLSSKFYGIDGSLSCYRCNLEGIKQ